MNKKIVLAIFGIIIVVLGVVFALWLRAPKGYPSKMEPITLGTVLQEPSIPIFVAEDQEYFARNGLDVTLRYYDSGAQAISGVLKDEVNMLAPTSEYILVRQVLHDEAIQTIGCIDKLDFTFVIGRKDYCVKDVSDLKGKRIGLVRGTATEFFLGRFLTLHGLDTKDVTLVDRPSNSQLTNAIVNGDVDAVISVSPYAEEAQTKLGGNAVSWPAQGSQMIHLLAICKDEWISAHPALVERFLKAINQAEEFIVRHRENASVIAKKKLNLTDEDLAKVWARNQFSLSLDQSLIAAMEDEVRWMIKNKLTKEKQVPDFLNYIYIDGLEAVKPEAVKIIR